MSSRFVGLRSGKHEIQMIGYVDRVRVLGVLITPDLSLDKHVSDVSGKCFFRLRQIRQIRRSLDDECKG